MKLKLLFLFILSSLSLNAQLEFSPEEGTHEVTLDLSDPWIHTVLRGHLLNNTTDDVEIKFDIVNIDAPSEWSPQFNVTLGGTDFGFTYNLLTNIDSTIGLNLPVPIAAADSSIMDLRIRPDGVAGCGTYEVRVSLTSDTSNIVATGIYNFKVNSPDCTTSLEKLNQSQIKIFPNPVNDFFSIEGNQSLYQVQIFNMFGQQILNTSYQNGTSINMISFPKGCYLVKMSDKNGVLIKTSRLVKN